MIFLYIKIDLPGLQNRPTGPTTEQVLRIILTTEKRKAGRKKARIRTKSGALHPCGNNQVILQWHRLSWKTCAANAHKVISQTHVKKLHPNYDETRKERSMKTDDEDFARSVLFTFLTFQKKYTESNHRARKRALSVTVKIASPGLRSSCMEYTSCSYSLTL